MKFNFLKANFNGDPNVGLYGFATDNYALLGCRLNSKAMERISKTLNVNIHVSPIAETELVGLFATGNKNGLIITKLIEDYELAKIKKELGINVLVIKSRETANGNLILCNDKGAVISNLLKIYKDSIAETLGVETEIGSVADLDIVGSAAIASNAGCLCHREASEEELKLIETILKVRTDVGTVGYGSPYIKAGIIVNKNGIIISDNSTGPEMGRCDELFNTER